MTPRSTPGEAGAPEADNLLIDSLYQMAVDPARYDALMSAWGQQISAFAEQSGDAPPGETVTYTSELERHFERAHAILERLGRGPGDDPITLIQADPQPALLLQRDGRIAVANAAAVTQLGAKVGAPLADLPLDAGSAAILALALTTIDQAADGAVVAVVGAQDVHSERRIVLALTKAASVHSGSVAGRLIALELGWNAEAADRIAGAFQLSPAEIEVARALVTGESLAQLAARRQRSLATVRTQAKTLLGKCGLHTQGELIRLFAGYALLQPRAAPRRNGAFSVQGLTLADGRTLSYAVQGDDGGRPVLLIHGMLTGIRLNAAADAAFASRGLKLITPWRPSFAGSSPHGGPPRDAPLRFAADLAALFDHLGVAAAPVIGHMSGSVFAFAAAAALPGRCSAVVGLSGGVPMTSWRQIKLMSPRQRIVAYTARFAPRLLPAIVRAGIAQMDAGGMKAFIGALYRHAPADLKLTEDREIFALMEDAYRNTVAQGSRGFEIDAVHVVRDWSEEIARCPVPALLLHGSEDPVVHISTVRALAVRHPALRLHEYPGRGHLLLHTEANDIAERISLMAGNG